MDSNWNLKTLWVIPLVCFMAQAPLPASAAVLGGEEPMVAMSVHGGSVSFSPRVGFDRMTLTVVGMGHVFRQIASSGEAVSFAPVDQEGYSLPDGTYNWEIVASSRLEDASPDTAGATPKDGRTVEANPGPRGPRDSGVFTIKNGSIVDASVVEIESARAEADLPPETTEPPSEAARSAEHAHRNDS
jgi:hypothetical protein